MEQLKIEYLGVNELTPYENNARKHQKEDVKTIINSIKEFGMCDPIGIWGDKNIIVEGHGRLMALKELGYEQVPTIRLDHLTDEQRKAYGLAHNKTAELSIWDDDMLAAELDAITDIDMTDFGFQIELESNPYDIPQDEKGSLVEQFGVPPFSVLDTRQAYWKDRKKQWLEITGDLSETRDGEFGKLSGKGATLMDGINGGTSNFDPVLAETMYKWFCPENGKILDPFGGEQTKGVVAGKLGYEYRAVEIRAEQVALNSEKTKDYPTVKYFEGDSNNISQIIQERGFDMCFTSPPYYDLEVYSKTDMSALGTYEEFMAMYENIFSQCYDMMGEDSFLVIKIGEIRNKKTGEYRSFVADNIDIMRKLGFKYYNEIILLNSAGTAPLRASNSMQTRKVVKIHQNVIVFYKGDLKNISNKYKKLNFEYEEDEDAEI